MISIKRVVISVALTMLFGTPALAQAFNAEDGTGNVQDMAVIQPAPAAIAASAANAFAAVPSGHLRGARARAVTPNDDAVDVGGQYIGQDPDPNVRAELRRDWMHE
jgi:hypothetical protein